MCLAQMGLPHLRLSLVFSLWLDVLSKVILPWCHHNREGCLQSRTKTTRRTGTCSPPTIPLLKTSSGLVTRDHSDKPCFVPSLNCRADWISSHSFSLQFQNTTAGTKTYNFVTSWQTMFGKFSNSAIYKVTKANPILIYPSHETLNLKTTEK